MDIDEEQTSSVFQQEDELNKLISKILKNEIIIDTNRLNLESINYLFEKAIANDITNIGN